MTPQEDDPDFSLVEYVHHLMLRLGLVRTVQTAYKLTDVSLWPFIQKLRERGITTSHGRLSPDSLELRRYLNSR